MERMNPWDDLKETLRRRMDVSKESTLRQIEAEFKVALKQENVILSRREARRLLLQIIEDLYYPPPKPPPSASWPDQNPK